VSGTPPPNGQGRGTNGEPTAKSAIAKRRAAAKADASEQYRTRRREIVHAAAAVFRAQGLAGTSIDDIARAAGVDRATLYYYVGGKEELFGEVIADAVVNNIRLAEARREDSQPPEQKLHALIADLMSSYAQFYPHLYVYLREDAQTICAATQADPDIVELQRRFDRALTAIVREGMESGIFRPDVPPRLVAYGIIGMLNWTHRWFDPDGPDDAGEVAKAFATLVIEGLRAR
jgi:AcrR family transcriptional regulator